MKEKKKNIIVLVGNMLYAAVILDNYLEAIESEKKGDLYNAAKYYKCASNAFNDADIPDWSREIGEMGIEAGYKYDKLVSKIARKRHKEEKKTNKATNKILKKKGEEKVCVLSFYQVVKEIENMIEADIRMKIL